jgi:hypothetical protein
MRALHERGVPFWERAWEVGHDPKARNCFGRILQLKYGMQNSINAVPERPEDEMIMYGAMWYASCLGASVTPTMEKTFRDRRTARVAVLLSFHVAARLSQGQGRKKQRAAWGGMACMPPDLT